MTVRSIFRIVTAIMVAWTAPPQEAVAAACPKPIDRPFQVFDGMLHADKPDLAMWGFRPVHIIDRGIWPDKGTPHGHPDPRLVRRELSKLPQDEGPIVLNFEDYELSGSDRAAESAVRELTGIITSFRRIAPHRQYGFFDILPIRDYWRSVEGRGSSLYRGWQRENDRLAALEPKVSALFPNVYTFYDDPVGWVRYATEQVCEARRLSSKPVYLFLWPEYHPSSDFAGRSVDPRFWRLQLETALEQADGVVIWGGYDLQNNRGRNWSERGAWWTETLRFMTKHNIGRR